MELARLAFDKVNQLHNNLAPANVLMANIYAASGMYKDKEKTEVTRVKGMRG